MKTRISLKFENEIETCKIGSNIFNLLKNDQTVYETDSNR